MANFAVMAALSAASAVVQKASTNKQITSAAEANNRTLQAAYNEAGQREDGVNQQAAEQTTDRMRQAQRQISMARVLAAETGASLDPQVVNATAASGTDLSRIETNRANAIGSAQAGSESARVSGQNAASDLNVKGQLSSIRFLTDVAEAGAGSYSGFRKEQAAIKRAKGVI